MCLGPPKSNINAPHSHWRPRRLPQLATYRSMEGREEERSYGVVDLASRRLQEWTKENMRKRNGRKRSGGTGYPRQVSFWPMGLPASLLYLAQPIYFIQTSKEVTIIAQMDQQ